MLEISIRGSREAGSIAEYKTCSRDMMMNEDYSKVRRVHFNDRSIVGPCALLDLNEQSEF